MEASPALKLSRMGVAKPVCAPAPCPLGSALNLEVEVMRVTTPCTVEVSTTYVMVGTDGLSVGLLDPGVRLVSGLGLGLGRRLLLPLEVKVAVIEVLPVLVVVVRLGPGLGLGLGRRLLLPLEVKVAVVEVLPG
jgi:hypothetical protein